jgi:micrococcal nuclease
MEFQTRKNKILATIVLIILFILSIIYLQTISDPQITEGTVTRVIDGDTLELENGQIVRLTCINTPEKGTPYAKEATELLESLVLEKEVILEKDTSDTDKYRRLLRYVYLDESGLLFVNELIVREGYAKILSIPPNTRRCEDIADSERFAQDNKLGIWS